jgi:hypothetical protein
MVYAVRVNRAIKASADRVRVKRRIRLKKIKFCDFGVVDLEF